MKIYKDCNGKRIDKCRDCKCINFSITRVFWEDFTGADECIKRGYKLIPDINTIPSWCPLEDYKEVDREKPV